MSGEASPSEPGEGLCHLPCFRTPAIAHTSQMLGHCGVCGVVLHICAHQDLWRWASPPAHLKLSSPGDSDSDAEPVGRAIPVVGTDPKLLPPPEDPPTSGSSLPRLGSIEQMLSGPSLQGLGQVLGESETYSVPFKELAFCVGRWGTDVREVK